MLFSPFYDQLRTNVSGSDAVLQFMVKGVMSGSFKPDDM
jgi:hypothetical protein